MYWDVQLLQLNFAVSYENNLLMPVVLFVINHEADSSNELFCTKL
jgi:hypothetical protein